MDLTINVDGWPGTYHINSEACVRVVPATTELAAVADGLDDLLDGMPTWTH